jgi:hypothetical protein
MLKLAADPIRRLRLSTASAQGFVPVHERGHDHGDDHVHDHGFRFITF